MSTEPQATAIPAVTDEFALYPLYKVISVFTDAAEAQAAVDELSQHGFADDDIEAYWGETDRKKIDFNGTRHGVWASFVRAIQHVGPERTYLERYEQHLRDGDYLIMVAVANKERKETAGRILNAHTKERVTYFGLLAANEIKP